MLSRSSLVASGDSIAANARGVSGSVADWGLQSPTQLKRDRRVLVAFAAIVFGSLIPSQGVGVSWDEILELVTILVGAGHILSGQRWTLRRPLVIFGTLAAFGSVGMLTHEDGYAVLSRCIYIALFVLGLLTSSILPPTTRSTALLFLGIGALFGATLAAYLDLHGWTSEGGVQSGQEWQEGARGLLSSRTPYTILAVPLLIAYARRWRLGPYIMAAVVLPYALFIAGGVGQGRGQTLIVLLGCVLSLTVYLAIPAILILATGVLVLQLVGWQLEIPSIFSGLANRVSATDIGHIDRIEHAQASVRLLTEASAREIILGIPTPKIELLVQGAGIHSGYLEPAVVGGLVAAIPQWLLFGYLFSLALSKKWHRQDPAGLAGLVVIVEVAVVLAAAPLFWEWHSAWYYGLACGLACSPMISSKSVISHCPQ